MKDLPQHTVDEQEELKREKLAHAKLIEYRREQQRKVLLEELAQKQSARLRNILK